MAQTTIMAAGQAEALSSDVTLANGETKTIGIFASSAIPQGVALALRVDTPGRDNTIYALTRRHPTVTAKGPGTYRVHRPDISAFGVDVGVYSEA